MAEYRYFEYDGAFFRRLEGQGTRSIDDVLHAGVWSPYKGADPLAPALFGSEISDPTER